MKKKTCLGCQRKLPLYQFHVSKDTADGRGGRCRTCCKLQRDAAKKQERLEGEAHRAKFGVPARFQSLCETRI